ncbi:MAG TPA: tetratricopeptide repeat protein, partial [Kofleriaceae bacterium]
AMDVLQRVRATAPGDPRIAQLISEGERAVGKPNLSASHPSVGFVGGKGSFAAEESTKHYPHHGAKDREDDGFEDTGGSFTRPTSLQTPEARKRGPGNGVGAVHEATPPPDVLAIGDRSGTVDIDPDLDGVEMAGDDDFGELAAPPRARAVPLPSSRGAAARRPLDDRSNPDARGQVIPARKRNVNAVAGAVAAKRPNRKQKEEVSTVELDDDEMIEVDETVPPRSRQPGPGTAVRNAVKMPSGPIDAGPVVNNPAAARPTQHQPVQAPPPHLAQLMAAQQQSPMPLMPPPQQQMRQFPPPPGHPIAAALPTMAAPMPPHPHPHHPQHQMPSLPVNPAAIRPTMALNPAQMQSAAAVDAMFDPSSGAPPPPWAQSTMAAPNMPGMHMGQIAANEVTRQPMPVDPQFAAMFSDQPSISGSAVPLGEISQSSGKALKTGMRRGRSKLQIIMWFVIGGLVIGGGVFAGFQIRAMRLKSQISEARTQAIADAKADTWKGWTEARDRLAGIAQASATPDNRAALARSRALVAFEFGDGLQDAKAAVEQLGEQRGLDAAIARAYLALAQSDPKAARQAAEEATQIVTDDPSALYVTGRAQLLAGEFANAFRNLKSAYDREKRPLYAVGLAQAYGEASMWKEALAALEPVIAVAADHPSTVIERARILVASHQIVPGNTLGPEVRAQLQKLISEGMKKSGEQSRGVSPAQVAMANLALARVDFLRGDLAAAQADFRNALAVGIDEQLFAEDAAETLYAIGELTGSRTAADRTLQGWSNSRRARIILARVMLALGKTADALDLATKVPDVDAYPYARTVRGMARYAGGDVEGARGDFLAALKKAPNLELALVGRTWLDLETEQLDDELAKKLEDAHKAYPTHPAIATAHAAILRATDPKGGRDKARAILDKIVTGAPGPEVARAQLELARIYRDSGDMRAARALYENAVKAGSYVARLETGLLLIEDLDPSGGRDTLDQLYKSTERPTPQLILETARARMLVGDHAGAAQLLADAGNAPNVNKWHLQREKGRLALRRNDFNGAADAFLQAIEGSGSDVETFLLAADVAAADEKQAKLMERVKALAPKRLQGLPELDIVNGKLLLSKGDEALKAYDTAAEGLKKVKASSRRQAQAFLGRGIVAYNDENDQVAKDALEFAVKLDPSLYTGYLYLADITKEQSAAKALEHAQAAVKLNPQLLEGWFMVGTQAARTGNRKLLAEAITKVGEIEPNSDALRQLQGLR